jgi:pimeloyl-ACP methyl ester carboxylesterase
LEKARIYYEIRGNSKGPVILLLHGGLGSIEDFNPLIPILNEKYCVIGVDSRAHGKSTLGGQKLTYERLQRDIESLLHFLKINTVTLIGFSDGAIVAYRLAAFSSLTIEKMVAIGSTWHVNDLQQREELFKKLTAESWKQKFPETYELYQKYNPEPDFDRLTEESKNMWLDKGLSGHPNEQVEKIKSPLLLVRGDTDHLTTRRSHADLANLVKGSTYLNIPFAGHVPYLDQPDIVRISLKQFLGY